LVFTVPLTVNLSKQIQPINVGPILINDSTGGGNALGNIAIQAGILVSLSSNLAAISAGKLPKKGQLYVQVSIVKTPAGQQVIVPVFGDYIYNNNDMHWIGELPIEDGDAISVGWSNTLTNTYSLRILGYSVRPAQ
jgi:hypothetical protein